MARLPYPDKATFPPDYQEFLTQVPRLLNHDMLSYSVSTFEHFMRQAQAQFTELELPARTRELVIPTTAATTGTAYEFVQHVPISEASDVSPEVREAIHRREFGSPALSAYDRAVTVFAAAVVAGPVVSDAVFTAVRGVLGNREIVEALQVIGFYWSFGRVATVLEVEVEPTRGEAVLAAAQKAARH